MPIDLAGRIVVFFVALCGSIPAKYASHEAMCGHLTVTIKAQAANVTDLPGSLALVRGRGRCVVTVAGAGRWHVRGWEPRTFDFLGFTHYWGRSQRGGWVVKRKTAKSRLKRALSALSEWCRKNLHLPIREQHQKLTQKLRGHYGYYGIIGNFSSLQEFREETRGIWRHTLSRRRRDGDVTWAEFLRLEKRYSLPRARVVHGLRSSVAKS